MRCGVRDVTCGAVWEMARCETCGAGDADASRLDSSLSVLSLSVLFLSLHAGGGNQLGARQRWAEALRRRVPSRVCGTKKWMGHRGLCVTEVHVSKTLICLSSVKHLIFLSCVKDTLIVHVLSPFNLDRCCLVSVPSTDSCPVISSASSASVCCLCACSCVYVCLVVRWCGWCWQETWSSRIR